MTLPSHLLTETVQYHVNDRILILNSSLDPFVCQAAHRQPGGTGIITLAEDNIAVQQEVQQQIMARSSLRYVPFHNYILEQSASSIDVAVMNILYQPSNTWMYYGLQTASYALHPGGKLYVVGAKDRGIMTVGKRMQEIFGNVETLVISKGHRVLCSVRTAEKTLDITDEDRVLHVFASNKLDEGTKWLLDCIKVQQQDQALDLGCGAGYIGLYIAQQAEQGYVTMVDASLAAVATSKQAARERELKNVEVLASDGAQAVAGRHFSLIATNPPFHRGGVQTTEIAERFIREATQILTSDGRFYLVANRFLKYEPTLQKCFQQVTEVGGDTRYKVLLARSPL